VWPIAVNHSDNSETLTTFGAINTESASADPNNLMVSATFAAGSETLKWGKLLIGHINSLRVEARYRVGAGSRRIHVNT